MKLPLGHISRTGILPFALRKLRDAQSAWHQFWFDPADPVLLGVMRLLTGGMLFYNLSVWTLDLEAFFSNEGLQPLAAVRRLHETQFIFSFWLWTGDTWLWPIHFTCLSIAAMFCTGLFTRVTSVLSFLITISYSQRVPIANFGLDQILGMLCLYLSVAPCGSAFSVDSLLRRRRKPQTGNVIDPRVQKFSSARIAIRLIQLHLCAIYFWSGHAKLKGSSWWTGDAMWRVLANEEYQTLDLTWMAWVPWLPYLIAHVTVVWEVFFVVLVWNLRLRAPILLTGVAMHIGIGAFLGMWTFGLIMIFTYLAFLDPDTWRSRLSRFFSRLSQRRSIVASSVVCEKCAAVETMSPPAVFKSSAHPPLTAELNALRTSRSRICIVAAGSADRSALRRYLLAHQYDCRAVADTDSGLDVISRHRFDAVLVSGAKLSAAKLVDFAADVADLTSLPIVLMLTQRQRMRLQDAERCLKTVWIELPASLQEIRLRLEAALQSSEKCDFNLPFSTALATSNPAAADSSDLRESEHAST